MDLALELGMTVGEMTSRMAVDELQQWTAYARKRALPARRMELYLAQVAQVTRGGRLSEFLLGQPGESADGASASVAADVLASMVGGKVHVLKLPNSAKRA